jgi:hypothetical protein
MTALLTDAERITDLIARCKVWAASNATPFPQSEVLADAAREMEAMVEQSYHQRRALEILKSCITIDGTHVLAAPSYMAGIIHNGLCPPSSSPSNQG